MRAFLLAAVVVAVAFAGCSGGDDEPVAVEVAPGQTVTVSEAPKPTHGIVSGIVGDDALYPLPGAEVWILGLNRSTVTDSNGRFAIVNVPAGVYILEGSKKDHATVQTTADVLAGETARAVLLLERLPPSDPYHSTFQQDAFIEFTAAGFVVSDSNTTLTFERDPSRCLTVVLESTWDGITTTETTPLAYRVQEVGLREILAARAPNPFSVHVDARVLPPDHNQFLFTVEPGGFEPTVVAQAHGKLYATLFYNEPAPPGWSLLNGDV